MLVISSTKSLLGFSCMMLDMFKIHFGGLDCKTSALNLVIIHCIQGGGKSCIKDFIVKFSNSLF